MVVVRITRRTEPDMTRNLQNAAKIIAVRRSRTLHLPAVLDSAFAPTLAEILRACHGEDITIDASYVQQTSDSCALVLRTARDAWETERHSMTFVNEPSALSDLLSNAAREARAA
jgi:anti-anti-sigma regulatory factor